MASSQALFFKAVYFGFFGTSIAVTNNGTEIAKLVMNWRGQIVFTVSRRTRIRYKIKWDIFQQIHTRKNDEEKLIQFESKFNWRNFQYTYEITTTSHTTKYRTVFLLILLGVYATNYFIACMSGANAGMA